MIGTPLCWMHLLSQKKLRVKTSTIPHAGKGLFVMARRQGPNDIVFRSGDVVVDYSGESITERVLQNRYGEYTAPYGLREGNQIEDGACLRGAGTIANHGTGRRANVRYSFSRAAGKFRLVATKNIRNGQEILANYGNGYKFNEHTTHTTTRR